MKDVFKIYKVNSEEALRIAETDNSPHKHDFEELIIGIKGKLEHFIDFNTHFYEAPFISFVTRGKIHRVQPHLILNECDFWVIRFKSEFIADITFQLYNFYHDKANFELTRTPQFERIVLLCQFIYDELHVEEPKLGAIKDLLSALFAMIEAERKKLNNETNNILSTQNKTFQSFLAILEQNFRRNEGVSFYAEKLFTSTKTLNAITQNILHQTVSEIIETRKLIEAKNLLFTTDMTVSEIRYEIGYTDKAYFTSVFKKKSGQTPTEFREEMKKIIS